MATFELSVVRTRMSHGFLRVMCRFAFCAKRLPQNATYSWACRVCRAFLALGPFRFFFPLSVSFLWCPVPWGPQHSLHSLHSLHIFLLELKNRPCSLFMDAGDAFCCLLASAKVLIAKRGADQKTLLQLFSGREFCFLILNVGGQTLWQLQGHGPARASHKK